MGKRRLSSVQSSAEELLSAAASQISTKPGKSEIKTLIWSAGATSDLISSLPAALHLAVVHTLDSFKQSIKSSGSVDATTGGDIGLSCSPAVKKVRRSSRLKRQDKADGEAPPPIPGSETLDFQKKLQAYAYISQICVSHPQKIFSPSDLLPAVQFLHDNLVLYEFPALLSEVSSLCEFWWKDNLPERESLITQLLPFLLSKSLIHGKKTDVYRVYALREAFTLFDYEDESIEDLRLLLVRCLITPVYLKTKEGRRFIAFIVGLNDLLLKEAMALARSQIPFGKKSVLEGYADIIFKAWRGSGDSVKVEIELGFLQGLIDGAIHAQTKLFSASIRRVLSRFISQRTTPGVDKLLFRLAEPVLFRSLQVANSDVRRNALFLLLDLFPLEDPDVTKEEKDTLLEKQFFLLHKLLLDDCPEIRAVTVEGLCRILNLFWEVIPSLTITKVLGKVIDDMSLDMCNEVRLSTLNGIIYLLENPQSHEVMKVLLPRLGGLLFDPSLSVRIATTDLLLEVGRIRAFQFNKVVSLESLFSSLANDHERVAQKITRLLIPSYFPSTLTPKEACSRFIALMRRSPVAGARFCEFALSEGSSSKSLLELLRFSLCLILEENPPSSDQLDGLIIASANIFSCIATQLSDKVKMELFSVDKLKSLLSAATSSRALAAVLTIASMISPNDLYGLRDRCLDFVIECIGLSNDLEKQGLVRKIHRLCFSCGWFTELCGILSSSLQSIASRFLVKFGLGMPPKVLQSLKKKIKLSGNISGRFGVLASKEKLTSYKSKSEKDLGLAAGIAWQIKDLIADDDMRKTLSQSPNFEISFHSLNVISQVSIEMCVRNKSFDASPIAALASLAVYLSLQKDDSEIIKNDAEDGLQCTNSYVKFPTLDNTLNNLLHWAEKMFNRAQLAESATPSSSIYNDTEMLKSATSRSRHKTAAASASKLTDASIDQHPIPSSRALCRFLSVAQSIPYSQQCLSTPPLILLRAITSPSAPAISCEPPVLVNSSSYAKGPYGFPRGSPRACPHHHQLSSRGPSQTVHVNYGHAPYLQLGQNFGPTATSIYSTCLVQLEACLDDVPLLCELATATAHRKSVSPPLSIASSYRLPVDYTMFLHSLETLTRLISVVLRFWRSMTLTRSARSLNSSSISSPPPASANQWVLMTTIYAKGSEFKLDMPEAKCIENVMKMCSSILKFCADTTTMKLVDRNDISYLRFSSAYTRHVLSSMRGYRHEVSSFKEEDLKEVFYYLKSSFTYSAKLLHLVLQQSNELSTVPVEAFYLSNDLIDLITAVEPYFGIKYASQMLSIVKPWLPVLILGVGCNQLIKPRQQECESNISRPCRHHFPTWLAVLSKTELHEISRAGEEENDGSVSAEEASVFTKFILMVVVMLKKGSLRIMDAIGCVLLVGLDVGLETRDFGLVLGLVHFICVKLLGKEFTSWKELEQMTSYLQEIYPRIESEITNPSLSEDERGKLETAKTLLTSLWLNRE
ncbi:hypothetical protein KSP39_PZI009237 [Platanthera zijinensis]|uniref:Condensin-2 complex subunit G2 n=1 Tax=Platanthera zijinensis TaxID=2320716 RepID=A0AAP0G7D6_9ASPA